MADTADAARIRAYAEKRSMIVSIVWVVLAMVAALVVGWLNGGTDDTRLDDIGGNLDALGPWILGHATAEGVFAGLLFFVPLYFLILRKSEFGTFKASLLILGAGLFGALTAAFVLAIPAKELTLTAIAHRRAALDDIRSFDTRTTQADVINPLSFDNTADVLDAGRKLTVIQGLIAERQARQVRRRAELAVNFKRISGSRRNMAELAAALTQDVAREDALIAQYWSQNMAYYTEAGDAAAFLALHPSDWRMQGTKFFLDRPIVAPWQRRVDRLSDLDQDIEDTLASINASIRQGKPQPNAPLP